jgi:hypothetical protein
VPTPAVRIILTPSKRPGITDLPGPCFMAGSPRSARDEIGRFPSTRMIFGHFAERTLGIATSSPTSGRSRCVSLYAGGRRDTAIGRNHIDAALFRLKHLDTNMRFAVVHGVYETSVVGGNPIHLAIGIRESPAGYEVTIVVIFHDAYFVRAVS